MADDRRKTLPDFAAPKGDLLQMLARDAIRELSERVTDGPLDDPWDIHALRDAFLAETEAPRRTAIERLLQAGASTDHIIDRIIPDVARLLGQHWADDVLSFAEVSIGSARLQETVRSLRSAELSTSVGVLGVNPDRHFRPTGQRILMIIPRPEDHTLGAFVAADQLRRLGYEVDLAVDQHPRQVSAMLRKHHYVMVGITAAGRRTLASAKELVDIIRTTVTRVTPIVLGGSLVGSDLDLKAITGAHHVTNDVRVALRLCGLSVVEEGPSPRSDAGFAEWS